MTTTTAMITERLVPLSIDVDESPSTVERCCVSLEKKTQQQSRSILEPGAKPVRERYSLLATTGSTSTAGASAHNDAASSAYCHRRHRRRHTTKRQTRNKAKRSHTDGQTTPPLKPSIVSIVPAFDEKVNSLDLDVKRTTSRPGTAQERNSLPTRTNNMFCHKKTKNEKQEILFSNKTQKPLLGSNGDRSSRRFRADRRAPH